jgi:hypothetical protein
MRRRLANVKINSVLAVRFKKVERLCELLRSQSYEYEWNVAPCSSLREVDQSFRGAYCLHNQCDDGGNMHF